MKTQKERNSKSGLLSRGCHGITAGAAARAAANTLPPGMCTCCQHGLNGFMCDRVRHKSAQASIERSTRVQVNPHQELDGNTKALNTASHVIARTSEAGLAVARKFGHEVRAVEHEQRRARCAGRGYCERRLAAARRPMQQQPPRRADAIPHEQLR